MNTLPTLIPTPERHSPGGQYAALLESSRGERVSLRELPFLPMTALLLDPCSTAGAAVEWALGVELPRRVGAVGGSATGQAKDGEVSVLWISPEEFLVTGTRPAEPSAPQALTERIAQALAAVRTEDSDDLATDVGSQRTVLELAGPLAREVLRQGITHDLHDRAFLVGRAVSCLLDTVPVILWRTGDQRWRLLPRSSFTGYVVTWCAAAMQEHLEA